MTPQEAEAKLLEVVQQGGYRDMEAAISAQALSDAQGTPIQAPLADAFFSSLANGQNLHFYQVGEDMPHELKVDKSDQLKLDSNAISQMKAPQTVSKPNAFIALLDSITSKVGFRFDSCKKYEAYEQHLAEVKMHNDLYQKYEAGKSSRAELDPVLKGHKAFSDRYANLKQTVEATFEKIKVENRFDLAESAFNKTAAQRTPEEQRASEFFQKAMDQNMAQKVHLVNAQEYAKVFKDHINATYFGQPGASYRGDGMDLFRDLAFYVKPGQNPTFDDYENVARAADNLNSNKSPETRVADTDLLRTVLRDDVGFLNDQLRAAGVQDNTHAIDQAGRVGLCNTADRLFYHAQAISHLGQLVCDSQLALGQMDVQSAQLAMRSFGIAEFARHAFVEGKIDSNAASNTSIDKFLALAPAQGSRAAANMILNGAGERAATQAAEWAKNLNQNGADLVNGTMDFPAVEAARALRNMPTRALPECVRMLSAIVVTDQLRAGAEAANVADPITFNKEFASKLAENPDFAQLTAQIDQVSNKIQDMSLMKGTAQLVGQNAQGQGAQNEAEMARQAEAAKAAEVQTQIKPPTMPLPM